jgi:hypothetical protein
MRHFIWMAALCLRLMQYFSIDLSSTRLVVVKYRAASFSCYKQLYCFIVAGHLLNSMVVRNHCFGRPSERHISLDLRTVVAHRSAHMLDYYYFISDIICVEYREWLSHIASSNVYYFCLGS